VSLGFSVSLELTPSKDTPQSSMASISNWPGHVLP